MSNQASEDGLRLDPQDELEEILSAMAFRCAGGITRSGRKEYTPAKAAIQALIRTEQKKLLAAVRKRMVGEDELRARQRQVLNKLEAEL